MSKVSLEDTSPPLVVDSYRPRFIDSNTLKTVRVITTRRRPQRHNCRPLSIHQPPLNVHAKISYRLLSDNGVRATVGFSQANRCDVSRGHGGVPRHMGPLTQRQEHWLCPADRKLPGRGGGFAHDSCRLTYFQ